MLPRCPEEAIRPNDVRPAIPARSMRTCQSLWDKGGGLRDAEGPLRRPIQGTEKGQLAKEVGELVQRTLLFIVAMACMKDRRGGKGRCR